MKSVAIIMGTRPEIIKLAPVIAQLRKSAVLKPFVILTGQHDELADTALRSFGITPDVDLELMTENQSPTILLTAALASLDKVLQELAPHGVIVQGDTTSALAGALAAFHLRIPVAHVEAGLRTNDLTAPFPEEMNRSVIGRFATFHFCPTERARGALFQEAAPGEIHVVGNTVVDALLETRRRIADSPGLVDRTIREVVNGGKKILYVTGHRRENFEGPLQNLCSALRRIAVEAEDVEIVFPVHPNPMVREPVTSLLANQPRITLLPAISYESSIFLLEHAALVITDSGGIQEEAPTFGVPVLVTRRSTERPEAVDAGLAELVELENGEKLAALALSYLRAHSGRRETENPFGDGHSAEKIREILEAHWG